MGKEDLSTREKIIRATISFIEKNGISAVTTRGIAKEANVNSAAINYYFGTKEKLLDETLNSALQNLKCDFTEIAQNVNSPGDTIAQFLFFLMAGSAAYPGITKANLYALFINSTQSKPFVDMFNNFINTIVEKISVKSSENTEDTRFKVIQLFSAVLMPSVFPELFVSAGDINFKDIENQKKYITGLVKHYFPMESDLKDWHPMPMK
jgi:AcrR family transcriptional regulator